MGNEIKYFRCGGAIGNSEGAIYRKRGTAKEFKKLVNSYSPSCHGYYGEERADVLFVGGRSSDVNWVVVAYDDCEPVAFARLSYNYKEGYIESITVKNDESFAGAIEKTEVIEHICGEVMKDVEDDSNLKVTEISKEVYEAMNE